MVAVWALALALVATHTQLPPAEALRAPAPAPSAGASAPQADGSFTLGPCDNATLLNSTHMRLEGAPPSVAWLQFSPQHRAGTLPTANFTDDAHGAAADWLGTHQASLFGTLNGTEQVVAMTLSSPVYDAANERLDLRYAVLEAEPATLPLAGGTVNGGMARDRANAANTPKYLTTPDAGTVFANATLIIDTTNTSQLAVEPEGGTRAGIIYVVPIG